jgi:hypothetical protein
LYRHSSGALVFSTGVYNWAWGLDLNHDNPTTDTAPDSNMQQATLNLFADMGVQAATLQPGLVAAFRSTDTIPPTSTITSPAAKSIITAGQSVTISGTASDTGGGVVAGVEVSTDGGSTWHPASGRQNWTYTWNASVAGATTLRSRAVDDSGNLETPSAGTSVTVNPCSSGCTIWSSTQAPAAVDGGPDSSVEVGVKFRADVKGSITGIRFYKASANTGKHVGSLWTSAGTLLASATFTGESASGWQQVNFSAPVSIAGNTTYVASYHTDVGHYSQDLSYFASAGVDKPPLHALANSVSPNGLYAYGSSPLFPTGSYSSTNYWVDLLFNPASLTSVAVTPANPTISTGTTQQFTAVATYSDGSTEDVTGTATWASSNTTTATISSGGLASGSRAGSTTISATQAGITGSTTLTVQLTPLTVTTTTLPDATQNSPYSVTLAANGGTPSYSWSLASGTLPSGLSLSSGGVISGTPTSRGTFGFTVRVTDASSQSATQALNLIVSPPAVTVWATTAVPGIVDVGPDGAVEVGVKFRAESNGTVTGLRFYKASTNTGAHVGNLWTSTGTLLASANFTNETASGWQVVNFPTPVAITGNTVYVASYHTNVGHYSADQNYFASAGVDNPPLHALATTVSPNGVYAYGSSSVFPNGTYNSTNYWVDVFFSPGTVTSVAVTPANSTLYTGSTKQFTATATYSDGGTQDVTGSARWASSNTTAATINASGLATAGQTGSTTISATQAGITGSTALTVQAPPLTITTTSLPDATQSVPYSVTLAANSGAPPYKWSLSSGTLPPGLALSTGGVLSGTPTTRGTSSFTVGVTDGSQSATKALSLAVLAPNTSLWAATAVPTNVDHGWDSAVELGLKFRSDVSGTVKGIRFYKATTNTGTHVGNLWTSTGTLLASATFTGETASGWQQVNFATAVSIAANTIYVVSYHTDVGHYSQDLNYFATMGVDSPPLHAPANSVSANGVYAYGATSTFPNGTYVSANYWVDMVYVTP